MIILYIRKKKNTFTKNDCSVEELYLSGWGEDSADAHKEPLADQFLCSRFAFYYALLAHFPSRHASPCVLVPPTARS